MSTSLSSVHIYADSAPDCGYTFDSFSPGWQTCILDFREKDPAFPQKLAKYLSQQTPAPVLHFSMFDSDYILLELYMGGKIAARYSDASFISNKKLYDIPSLLGLPEGQKRRLSAILACSDIELKAALLSEYLGLGLMFEPWMLEEGRPLAQLREDTLFRAYQQQEKALTGKAAPFALEKIAEIPGRLHTALISWDVSKEMYQEHRHLVENFCIEHQAELELCGGSCPGRWLDHHFYHETQPDGKGSLFQRVLFTDGWLKPVDYDLYPFRQKGVYNSSDPRFLHSCIGGTEQFTLTFSADCPSAWAGRTIPMPRGLCYYWEFAPTGELLLQIGQKLYVLEPEEKIVAKLPMKGCILDIRGEYILSDASSDSGSCFDSRDRIVIYRLVRKSQ